MFTQFISNLFGILMLTILVPDACKYGFGINYYSIPAFCVIAFIFSLIKSMLKFLTFPAFFLTLGLWSIVINIIAFWITIFVGKKMGIIFKSDDLYFVMQATTIIYISSTIGKYIGRSILKKFRSEPFDTLNY